ncbi:hypothetical protein BX600DRAFT_442923 [Xylariales sp. PMI_506]|nr:hypothetical protein BX600DRAFT_442923 [Xylariales sp. PMI_506]
MYSIVVLATFLSGGLTSAIPNGNLHNVENSDLARREQHVRSSNASCGVYTTQTVTLPEVTLFATVFTTVPAETNYVTSLIDIESTQQVTDTATITVYTSIVVDETVTAATETETVAAEATIVARKPGCGGRRPSSLTTQLVNSTATSASRPHSYSASLASSLLVCSQTITVPALTTTITTTVTVDETATVLEYDTSVIVDTVTSIVSTTDVITTLVTSTVDVTATTTVTPVATDSPEFDLSSSDGSLYLASGNGYYYLGFTTTSNPATFYVSAEGYLVAVTNGLYGYTLPNSVDNFVITTPSLASSLSATLAQCSIVGGTGLGDAGTLTCVSGSLTDFQDCSGYLALDDGESDDDCTAVTMQYSMV